MIKNNCQFLGVLIKTHGTENEFLLKYDNKCSDDYKKLESVFIEIDEQLVPFFIASIKPRNINSSIVKFDDVNLESRIKLLLGCKVYITREADSEDDLFDFDHLVGFRVIDEKYGEIGEIDQFIDITNNPVLQIIKGDDEILVPVQGNILKSIDVENKVVYIEAPEGLIDIYLK